MATTTEIANFALTHLGETRILSLDQENEAARVCKLWFGVARKAALRSANWTCASKRVALAPLVDAPAYGFELQYELPGDFIRLVRVRRAADGREFVIEGQRLLTNIVAPLEFKYVFDEEDTSKFSPDLVIVLSYWLAHFISGKLAPAQVEKFRLYAVQAATAAKDVDTSGSSAIPLAPGSWARGQVGGRDPSTWGA
ncbi:MAG: hypothetical protein ACRDD1_18925 [Planctomycetia bacterium]